MSPHTRRSVYQSDQKPHVEKNLVEKSLEDVLTEACRVLALIDDAGAAFAASSDVVMGTESWWLLSELAHDAKKGIDAACEALPGRVTTTHLEDWAGLVATVVAKPVTTPAA